jgi:replicative DNA helicase
MMVWRPETYENEKFCEPHEQIPVNGLAQCRVEKGRNIGTGSFLLRFDPETTAFYDYDERNQAPLDYCNPNQFTEHEPF